MKYCEEVVDKICAYIVAGTTQKEAGFKAGICEDTFNEWYRKRPEFAERVKKAREEFRSTIVGRLEASLWKVALGFEAEETRVVFEADKEGVPRVKRKEVTKKNYAPNVTALIFALSNMAPDTWINRQRVDTKDVTKKDEDGPNYCFDSLPKEMLFDIADKLQEAKYKRIKEDKKDERFRAVVKEQVEEAKDAGGDTPEGM